MLANAHYQHPVRVYWEDTDAGGVVYYANYLKFFERARTEWLRSCGVAQTQLQAQSGILFVVVDAQVRYVQPARLDDALLITVRVQDQGAASLTIEQHALRDNAVLAHGTIRVGCVQATTMRPCRIPAQVLQALNL
jgi:acyl-CoA thioester hydrolase